MIFCHHSRTSAVDFQLFQRKFRFMSGSFGGEQYFDWFLPRFSVI
jgi:hypothetical protein